MAQEVFHSLFAWRQQSTRYSQETIYWASPTRAAATFYPL